jgi:hypothetical protein
MDRDDSYAKQINSRILWGKYTDIMDNYTEQPATTETPGNKNVRRPGTKTSLKPVMNSNLKKTPTAADIIGFSKENPMMSSQGNGIVLHRKASAKAGAFLFIHLKFFILN